MTLKAITKKHPDGIYFEINSIKRGVEQLSNNILTIKNFIHKVFDGAVMVDFPNDTDLGNISRFIEYLIENQNVEINII